MAKSDLRVKDVELYHAALFYFSLVTEGLKGGQALDTAAYFTGYDRDKLKEHIYGEVYGMDDPDFKHI